MRRLIALLFATAVAGCAGNGPDLNGPDPYNEGYTVIESCTQTTDCGDGGVSIQSFTYDTSNESNWFPDGGATFTNPNADGGSGGTTGGTPGGGDTPGTGGSTVDGGSTSGSGNGNGNGHGGGMTGGSSGSGTSGGMCSSSTSCNPSCQNTGKNDSCNQGGGAMPPGQGGCWVTGGGYIVDADGHDSFGGNAMPMKAGYVRGQWQEVDHGTGNKGHGTVKYIVCRNVPNEPGPGQPSGPSKMFDINQVYFGGPSRWFSNGSWADGYWFDVFVEDHGEPGNTHAASNGNGSGVPDYYHYTIRQMQSATQSGPVVYDTEGPLVGGNIQIHPPNNGHPYNGGTLPSWVSYQP